MAPPQGAMKSTLLPWCDSELVAISRDVPFIDSVVAQATTVQDHEETGLVLRLKGKEQDYFAPRCTVRVDAGEPIRAYSLQLGKKHTGGPTTLAGFQIIEYSTTEEGGFAESYAWCQLPHFFADEK